MEIKEFIETLKKSNFTLTVESDKLILKGDRKKLSGEELKAVRSNKFVISYIKENKDKLIDYLSSISEKASVQKKSENIAAIYRLSGLQQGMLFHGLYDEGIGAYIEQFGCDLVDVDPDILYQSWGYVIKRHSILRTAFNYDAFKMPVQCVYKEVKLPVEFFDYRGINRKGQEESIKEYLATDRAKGFDFNVAPLMRLALIRVSDDRYRMIWTSHHILFDGWSLPILMAEFLNAYESLISGKELTIREEDRFEDYIRFLDGVDKVQEELYWTNYLKGLEHNTLLPFIGATKERNKGAGIFKTLSLQLDTVTTNQIQTYAQRHKLTINTLFQGVWSFLLNSYTGNSNVVFGVIVSGRPDELPGVEQRVGMYINTLPLHAKLQQDQDILEWLQVLQSEQVNSRQFQYTSIQAWQEWSGLKGDVFDSLLIFENYPVNKVIASKHWALQVENIDFNEQTNYPLNILIQSGESISIRFSYNEMLLDEIYVEEIRGHFEHVLLQLIEINEGSRVADINLLTSAERQELLTVFNDTKIVYPLNGGLIDQFEEQVQKTPDATALIFGDVTISYYQLNERSNEFAHYLLSKGVKAGSLVPVCMERCIDLVIGILGILKVGGTYVPIDPDNPTERIRHILEDTGAEIFIAPHDFATSFTTAKNFEIVSIEDVSALHQLSTKPGIISPLNDEVCIIYTSGSSGRPKGVKLGNAGIINRLNWMWATYPFAPYEKNAIKTSIGFVDHIWELFGALNRGVPSVIFTKNELLDLDILIGKLAAEKITRWVLVPSLLRAFLNKLQGEDFSLSYLKYWISSGETLPADLVSHFYEMFPPASYKLLNIYGSSEVTADVTCYDTSINYLNKELGKTIRLTTIGKPISNTRLYIINRQDQLVAKGVLGEICVAGMPVARGYLNLPELTAERFTRDIFNDDPGSRMFRTGDIGRWMNDGNIEYLGRIDDQVKIRGNRVELGEIENALQQTGLVKKCVVLAKEDSSGNNNLFGYVVMNGRLDKQAVIDALKDKLPGFMVPAVWVQLEYFPLTSSGKIDKQSLHDVNIDDLQADSYEAPSNHLEIELVEIWQQLLGKQYIGIHDDFFMLGGHSLLAMRLVSLIRKALKMEIAIKDLFEHPTVASLAVHLLKQTNSALLPSIELKARPARIPLSFSQERIWFIDQLEGTLQYHLPAVLRLKGKLNFNALANALQSVVRRHESLRSVVYEEQGTQYQRVLDPANWELLTVDGPGNNMDGQGLRHYISQFITRPFDLSKDYMLRAALVILREEENVLVVTMHHISSDAWSMSVIVNEVVELYNAQCENRTVQMAPLQLQYPEFAVWQRDYLHGEVLDNKLKYWIEKLEGIETLHLPVDFNRPSIQSRKGAVKEFRIDKHTTEQLQLLCWEQGVTLYMTLLAAFNVLMYRYSGQNDICVGTTVANRSHQEMEAMIGFFVNTLALRNDVKHDDLFTEILQRVKTNTLDAFANQDIPFEKVVESVVRQRDLSRHPIFQVLFVLQNTPDIPVLHLGDVELSWEGYEQTTAQFELMFNLKESPAGIQGSVQYCTDLYSEHTIQRMIGHFVKLLQSIVQSPTQTIGKLSMLDIEEERRLLVDFNNTSSDYAKDSSVISLFEKLVTKIPESPALVFGETTLSYSELNARSNQLAHYLSSRGIGEETMVPICLEPGLEMIVGILGILKAGGTYVPVDPGYPQERIGYILVDTGAGIIITSRHSRAVLEDTKGVELLVMDDESSVFHNASTANLQKNIAPHQLAYIIYTSGSTGTPKGVMIEHGSLINYLLNHKTNYIGNDNEGSGSYMHLSFTFDASVTGIFMSLLSGKRLVIGSQKSVNAFEDVNLQKYAPYDFIKITPSHLELLQDKLCTPKGNLLTGKLVIGGEALRPGHFDQLIAQGLDIEIINEYGPTEATVGCSTYHFYLPVDKEKIKDSISIGKPIDNVTLYILGKDNELLPIGVKGELCIGGDGLARGYLNRAELTAEKFIPNPFSEIAGSKLYKTGDVCRWLDNGNIVYLGRLDDQVKIRGYRVELGEIESIIMQSGMVSQSVVVCRKDKHGQNQLAGYLVAAEDIFDQQALVNYLKKRLPEYMIPSILMELERFPLTTNGKIDKRALPDPEAGELMNNKYAAPRNELEAQLVEIWKDLLDTDQVGINDDFFEIGGHSLLAVRLVSAIRKQLLIELPVNEIFDYPTIALLASRLQKQDKGTLLPAIAVEPRPERIPLSFSQERLWFIHQLEGSVQYHLPTVIKLKGDLNIDALTYALKCIVNRHEVLRTIFLEENGQAYQYIKPQDGWEMSIIDGEGYKNKDKEALTFFIQQLINQPFDLCTDYLLRVSLMVIEEQNHLLVVTMHHIASDAWSSSIFVKEVMELYTSYLEDRLAQLPSMKLQYADYAIWQRKYLQGDLLDKKIGYWKNKLSDLEPLQMPVDLPRNAIQSTRGGSTGFVFDKEMSLALRQLGHQQNSTLFMTLLAVLKVLLYRYTSQSDICVGTGIASRQHQELEGLIGFFVNTLALRTEFNKGDTFIKLLQKVRETTLEAYANQEVPFEKVVDVVNITRDMSRGPVFQVMFVLQNTPEVPKMELAELQLTMEGYKQNTAKFGLSFSITEYDHELVGALEYNADLYHEETIVRLLSHLKQLVVSIIKDPYKKISELTILSTDEEHYLLREFNSNETIYPKDKTIIQLFEEQVDENSQATAVIFESKKITYLQLNERANQLARQLGTHRGKNEALVGVSIESSIEMMVAILGILKAGASYLPIDAKYPAERIQFILEDTGCQIIIADKSIESKLPVNGTVTVINLDKEWQALNSQPAGNLSIFVQPESLAYVIYTSGSTGKPKGVMVTQNNVVSLVKGIDYAPLSKNTILLSTGSTSFDATTFEYWGTLLNGGQLVLCSEISLLDNHLLKEEINKNRINLMWFTSGWFNQLVEADITLFEKLQTILVGGEKLSEYHIEKLRKTYPEIRIINGYGPTENTTFSLTYQVIETEFNQPIPIGRPLNNRSAFILDENHQLVPVGVSGEICLSGAGLTRGYFNRPELTAEKFVRNPFNEKRMYKTGDIGRWLPDGNIEYQGRKDEQVKIRGYRIELGEIENILNECAGVKQAAVIARVDKEGTNRLVGYVVSSDKFDKQAIFSFLRHKLPEYMIPALLVGIDHLPLNKNGKIDRNVLPDPDMTEIAGIEYEAPRNEEEKVLVKIWEKLLATNQVGIHDNFFEIGGDSLLAIRVVSALRKELGIEMPVRNLFKYQTIALLATQLKLHSDVVVLPSVQIAPRPQHIPLSFSQERLWFIDRLEGSVQYHISSVLRVKGRLNQEALVYTLKNIVLRHEVLRTVIWEQDGKPFQHIMDPGGWQLAITDRSIYHQDPEGLYNLIAKIKNEPFVLSKNYVFRVNLISLSETEHVMVVILHHIAADGWSMSVLVKEVVELYNAYDQNREPALSPLSIQYADYALWQRNILDGDFLNKKLEYWKAKLQDVKILKLPTDYERPLIQSTRGAIVTLVIDKEKTGRLLAFSKQHDCTLFMTLLAAFKVLLFRYTGQTDICVGSAIAGRQTEELDALIGFFVNTLALRTEVNGDASFLTLLSEVKTTTLEAYENQEAPFEKIVEAIVGERNLGTDPLVQVMFSLLNTPDIPFLQLGDSSLSQDIHEDNTALFELWMNIVETPGGLNVSVKYCTDLYKRGTIEQFVVHFSQLLSSIIDKPDLKIAVLEMLSIEERHQLLVTFNDNVLIYPEDNTIVTLFEKQVKLTPNNVAIVFQDQQCTYLELNERSNQLSHYLCNKGVTNESLVPLCIDRSIDLLVAILGILKAGGAYVPLDAEYPMERIKFMLDDTTAPIIIVNNDNKLKWEFADTIEIVDMDNEWSSIRNQPTTNLQRHIQPGSLAYIIYTSGSTGNPKGVMIEHRNVVSLVKGIDYLSLTEKDILLSTGSPSFDATTIEYWGMLLNGGQLVLCTENTLLDNDLLKKEIRNRKVTKMWFTSSWFNQLSEYDITIFKSLQSILVGGEKLSEQPIQKLRQTYPSIEIINGYGPTENTTFSLTYNISETNIDRAIPIGRPLNNRTAYVVDGYGQLVPVGVPGEIVLGGAGLARGYLKRPELTAEKFISNPFDRKVGARLYKTGDLGKWLPDGTLTYISRLDDQVKIRGFRIELGEVETSMNRMEQVTISCVVVKSSTESGKRIVAYYIPERSVIKAKERELYYNLVASWKELYETEYSKTNSSGDADPEFNIIGWNDSFTGEAIPAIQMQEWLNDIIEVIMSEKPEHVLEIGSGTGLIYYQLAGRVKKYIGTDFSRSSIDQIADRISKGSRDYGPTELHVCPAHEVSLKVGEKVDTIILNSIVQYFPGEDYMTDVMGQSISLLNGKGRIIVGDVRHNRLLELFKGRLLLKKLQESVSINEFMWLMEQDVLKEEELCFSPDYFYRLRSIYPQITHVEIKWKQGTHINELTLYRYTVIIYVGMEEAVLKPKWTKWDRMADKQIIFSQLQQGNTVTIKDVPNPRLWQEQLLYKGLKNKSLKTAGDILTTIGTETNETIQVKDILSEVVEKGFSIRFLVNEDPLKMNLVFEPVHSNVFIEQPYQNESGTAGNLLTNIPLFADISAILLKEIRCQLQQILPDYMIPSEIISINQLPLTNNGKVDRSFLSRREDSGYGKKFNYVAPRNETEQVLANIWQELLGQENISINDNFFEIGGHSLLGTRMISAIRRQLEAEVTIKDIFIHSTIASLAIHLQILSGIAILPPIELLPRPKNIPLSFSQERLWFIDQLEGSVAYNSPTLLRLKGKLNREALVYALKNIINRHEVLRTVYNDLSGKPFQTVLDTDGWQLSFIDGSSYHQDDKGLEDLIEKLITAPFDLSKDYMLRAGLVILKEDDFVLAVTMHHIASDGWSLSIIVKEIVELYSSFLEKRDPQLPELELQYANYAIWQRNYLQGNVLVKKLAYWEEKLKDVSPLLLPTDYFRPASGSSKGASENFILDIDLSAKLQELGRQEGATLFMVMLAAFKVLLYRYSGQEDITVGTSIANRPQQEVEGLVGFFVNTLALRSEVNGDMSFKAMLQDVKATTLEAYQHQDVSFEKVVEAVVKERDMSRSPLFQVMLVLLNTPEISTLRFGDMELSRHNFESHIAKFDITCFVSETSEGIRGIMEYRTDLYNPAFISRMIVHYMELLNSIVHASHQKIGLLPMLSRTEEGQLLDEFNCAEVEYPKDKSVVELFEEQVLKTPDSISLVFENTTLTYLQINERSNQLAHYLRSIGIKENTLVPLYLDRGPEMIIGILGILKAGSAYVPIDVDFPRERINYMLEDTASKIIVSSSASSGKLDAADGVIIIEADKVSGLPIENLSLKPSPVQLAYVIYTSGSTGKPKGVLIEHRSLVDYYYGLNKYTQIGGCLSFALVSTIATDLGNTVIYSSLLSGGALHVFSKESVSNIEYLHHYFNKHRIDCLKIVPSHWKALTTPEDLLLPQKLLLFGGEALHPEMVEEIRLSGSSCVVVNHYGPTETTIGKLLHEVKPGNNYRKTIPIGKPFSNTKVYVLSKEMALCPVGVSGQLYISGDGLARGYFDNPELTREKFVDDPFSKQVGSKMYTTGDLVKWDNDGNIIFLGRVDQQVKIRGYRIEMGEIEALLLQAEQVKQAVVIAREDNQGNSMLIAYVIPGENYDKEVITGYLKEWLPDYMIPSVTIKLEALPLTANGKIDRKALPDPDMLGLNGDKYVAPRNEAELKLSAIWEDVLEVEQVGVNDNFFELGGHSLLAVRLVSVIRKTFSMEMPIGDIFDYPTVALLAGQLANQWDTKVLPLIEKALPRPGHIPLSFSQERLWFIDQLGGSLQYHVPAVLRLTGKLNTAALASALQNTISRHEVLRTVYREEDGQPYQFVKDAANWILRVEDGHSFLNDEAGLHKFIQQLINEVFVLSEDYMLRATLICLKEDDHILVVTIHHIASDGWSRSILVNDFAAFYSAFEEGRPANLPVLPVQYADYSIWQRRFIEGAFLENKINYWKEQLLDVPALELPGDFKRPAIQSTRGAIAEFQLEKKSLEQLSELSQQNGATLFMTLLTTFKILLYRYSGQQDICVGTPIAGRQQGEVEGLIGFFVNTLAIRTRLGDDVSFTELLHLVRTGTLAAYSHQEVPFEKVVEAVVKERDLSRSPIFQVMFVFGNTPGVPELKMNEVSLSKNQFQHTTALFDITFFITENEYGLKGTVEYNTDLFSQATISRMIIHFKQLLASVVLNPQQRLDELRMLDMAEENLLLLEFNDTKVNYPEGKHVIDLFEQQVLNSPDKIAVVFEGKQITYRELNEKSNQLSHFLASLSVNKETLIPICIERSPLMIIAILGVLKSGGAYVPIDPAYPSERIDYMLQDTAAAVILTSKESRGKIKFPNEIEMIEIDTELLYLNQYPVHNPAISIEPGQLAYVIYTSGSTGKPKGVMLEHRNLYSFISWCRQEFSTSDFDIVYASTSICFDLSVFEIFYPLSIGRPLRIIENGLKIGDYLPNDTNVLTNTVPSVIQHLLHEGIDLTNISVLNMAGEPVPSFVQQRLDTEKTEVRNLYGPTEDTTYSTVFRLEKNKRILIGKPIANTLIHIVNNKGRLVPIGVPGEIYLGGAGLARGYLNQAELTSKKFIPVDFGETIGTRCYKTGDVGRWTPDGNIEYIGRIDDQVKIRGYRIEPGEIETILEQFEAVEKAVVLAKEDKQFNKQLVGYIEPKGEYDLENIISFLKDKIPAYMIPSLWVEVKNMPLTPNGKIDRKSLPDPDAVKLITNAYKAPDTEIEKSLVLIWQQLLGIEQIGIHDNFFTLGGHSLMVIKLLSIVKKRFGLIMPVPVIFRFPTIYELGNYLEWEKGNMTKPDDETTTFELINL